MLEWTILDRRKLLKLCETAKLKMGEKYCLAYHPSQAYRDLQEMGGVRLKELKDHTNDAGGAWGADTWACLVKDDVDEFDETETNSGLDNTKSKRAILIPVSVFSSAQIIKICDYLGQNDDYRRFGADEETPSGVEDGIRNLPQIPGSQELSIQLSSIEHPDDTATEEIVEDDIEFDDLPPHHDTFIDGEARPSMLRPNLSKNMLNGSRQREITELNKSGTIYFICDCGYSSANKSATSRHKCRSGDSVMFQCQECTKVCKNPGSLKRHVTSKHKNSSRDCTDIDDSSTLNTVEVNQSNETTVELGSETSYKCDICGKTLKSSANLTKHMERVHGNGTIDNGSLSHSNVVQLQKNSLNDGANEQVSNSQEKQADKSKESNVQCNLCGKTLKSIANLSKHKERVHKVTLEDGQPISKSSSKTPLSVSNIERLLDVSDKTGNDGNDESNESNKLGHPEAVAGVSGQGRVTRGQQLVGGRRRSLSLLKHKGRKR